MLELENNGSFMHNLLPRGLDIEGALSAIFFIKSPSDDCCCSVPLTKITFKWANLNLKIQRGLKFDNIFIASYIRIISNMKKYSRLEQISPYISLFETITSNKFFICKQHQTIKLLLWVMHNRSKLSVKFYKSLCQKFWSVHRKTVHFKAIYDIIEVISYKSRWIERC